MTVDWNVYSSTESLILPAPRYFYPAPIPVHHWQLRSLISAPTPNTIYYACNADVCKLDTAKKTRHQVARLAFSPRCLAAGYGWLIAGGEFNGAFAAVRIEEDGSGSSRAAATSPSLGVDALLPLDLGSRDDSTRQGATLSEETGRRDRERIGRVRSHQLGAQIVNSVFIHQTPRDIDYDEDGTIAVLTNNDQTVRLFSLTRDVPLHMLEFPFAMNHATISPDGKLLVAVGDEPTVYFYRRLKSDVPPSSRSRRRVPLSYEWEEVTSYHLTPALDPCDNGCFSSAFSPSGEFCAVASQDGVITIFQTALIDDLGQETAVLEVLPSSSPHVPSGAVRTLCFSPQLWDLLICTEHHGVVCVLDVRASFRSRQTVRIDPDKVERMETDLEAPGDSVTDTRWRGGGLYEYLSHPRDWESTSDEAAVARFTSDYVEPLLSGERRSTNRHSSDQLPGLTEHDRLILDTFRNTRERLDAREQRPISINYLPQPVNVSENREAPSSLLSSSELLGVTGNERAPSGTNPRSESQSPVPPFRDHFRERYPDRDRTRARAYEPRRRNSVMLSRHDPAATSTIRELSDSNMTTSPPRLPVPLDVMENRSLMDSSAFSAAPPDPAARLRRIRATAEATSSRREETTLRGEQRRREGLHNLLADMRSGSRYERQVESTQDPHPGLGTAGTAVSQDGRKIYIGTEDGIMELHVDIASRKLVPHIDPR